MNITKKIMVSLGCLLFILALTGCDGKRPITVNVTNSDSIYDSTFGETALIEIGNRLWYDATTRIVYWWTGTMGSSYSCTVPSPYYAPNGLPYRYNPETNTFEEIANEL